MTTPAIPRRFGGYQPPMADVFGRALRDRLGQTVQFEFVGNIIDVDHDAADLLLMVEQGPLTVCYSVRPWHLWWQRNANGLARHYAAPGCLTPYLHVQWGMTSRANRVMDWRTSAGAMRPPWLK